jgi:hypothetical protein
MDKARDGNVPNCQVAEMHARLAIDKLRVDTHPVLVALHRAFENIAHEVSDKQMNNGLVLPQFGISTDTHFSKWE